MKQTVPIDNSNPWCQGTIAIQHLKEGKDLFLKKAF